MKPLQKANKNKGLMYIDAKINGKPISTMVDIGVTYNFITFKEAEG